MIELLAWGVGATFGIFFELRALLRAVEQRGALIGSGKNGPRFIVATSFVFGAWIGLLTNIAYFSIGTLVIVVSQTSSLREVIPIVLILGMYAMNGRSFLAGRAFDRVAAYEERREAAS